MNSFPVDRIKCLGATISFSPETPDEPPMADIEIELEPIDLTADFTPDEIESGVDAVLDSSISLSGIELPERTLAGLAGRTLTFPVNPDDGYIDGSVYFNAAHHPVDVTRISFGAWDGQRLPVTLDTTWQMEFKASGYRDFSTTLHAVVEEQDPPDA